MIPVAAGLITAWTDAPHRLSEWISLTTSTAAILPVTATTTSFPFSVWTVVMRDTHPGPYAKHAAGTSSLYVHGWWQKNLRPPPVPVPALPPVRYCGHGGHCPVLHGAGHREPWSLHRNGPSRSGHTCRRGARGSLPAR